MKVGDKVIKVAIDRKPIQSYAGWVGQIKKIDNTIALVKWDQTYSGLGLWEYIDSLNVVDDSLVAGKQ